MLFCKHRSFVIRLYWEFSHSLPSDNRFGKDQYFTVLNQQSTFLILSSFPYTPSRHIFPGEEIFSSLACPAACRICHPMKAKWLSSGLETLLSYGRYYRVVSGRMNKIRGGDLYNIGLSPLNWQIGGASHIIICTPLYLFSIMLIRLGQRRSAAIEAYGYRDKRASGTSCR